MNAVALPEHISPDRLIKLRDELTKAIRDEPDAHSAMITFWQATVLTFSIQVAVPQTLGIALLRAEANAKFGVDFWFLTWLDLANELAAYREQADIGSSVFEPRSPESFARVA